MDPPANGLAKQVSPLVECSGVARAKGAVGAKRGIHASGKVRRPDLLVIVERIRWIIAGTHNSNLKGVEDALGGEVIRVQSLVRSPPYFRRCVMVQQFANAKVAAQLQ